MTRPQTAETKSTQSKIDPNLVDCCGCVPVRLGVFALIIFSLVYTIAAIAIDLKNGLNLTKSADVLISFILSGLNILALLVLLVTAIIHNVKVYGIAAKAYVFLWAVGMVVLAVTLATGSRPDFIGLNAVAKVLTVVGGFLVSAYWAWEINRYTKVLAFEVQEQKGQLLV
ncbi:hypothetical protein BCR44DRAFT_197231 [Catenaria anguillulae PL171]|uniref:MARVEL domain-containing protein n=1 Tax=Catenaria anguillulae PL171 TaxID=765915 RepID=A0A1Y2HMN4_9FUNG|nr:hypothetical protein BCR44DRAFT_197231 [Catenaria anguillulae PL171]